MLNIVRGVRMGFSVVSMFCVYIFPGNAGYMLLVVHNLYCKT